MSQWGAGAANTKDAADQREQLLQAWWRAWQAENFSWDGLLDHSFGPEDNNYDSNDSEDTSIHLWQSDCQDFWRIKYDDLSTGLNARARSDEEMLASGELMRAPDGKLWHIIHVPIEWPDGTKTGKSDWNSPITTLFWNVLKTRLDDLDAIAALRRKAGLRRSLEQDGHVPNTDVLGPYDCVPLIGAVFPSGLPTAIRSNRAMFVDLTWSFLPSNFFGLKLCHPRFDLACFAGSADFSGATFVGDASFQSAVFLEGDYEVVDSIDDDGETGHGELRSAVFEDAIFTDSIDFRGAFFDGAAMLSRVRVAGDADFAATRFRGHVSFQGSDLMGAVRFNIAEFEESADFEDCKLGNPTDSSMDIETSDDFGRDDVGGLIDFSLAHFKSAAFFDRTHFRGVTFLDKTTVVARASFDSSTFHARLVARGATFGIVTEFVGAAFCDAIDFSHSVFTGSAIFSGTPVPLRRPEEQQALELSPIHETTSATTESRLIGPAFTGTIIRPGDVDEVAGALFPRSNFRYCEFRDDADFGNRRFLAPTDFSYVQFRRLAEFHGSDLHQGIRFVGTQFAIAKPPKRQLRFVELFAKRPPKWTPKERRQVSNESYARFEQAFRTLKLQMEALRARNEELMFFQLELTARRRRSDMPLWEKSMSVIYAVTSDYGRSFARPLICLALLWIAGAAGYAAWDLSLMAKAAQPSSETWLDGAYFSAQIMFRPLSVWADQPEVGTLPFDLLEGNGKVIGLAARWIASLHAIFGLVCAFLAGLALRRRFQIN